MIDEQDQPTLYQEPGSTWWPVLWGPVFGAIGWLVEGLTGPVHATAWLLVGLGFGGAAAIWVNGRRRLCSVHLTQTTLRQGREELSVTRIAAVDDQVGVSMGARVLGGGWSVPRKLDGVPLKLDDGTEVLGWARDAAALRAALRRAVDG
jgi:hypothetical protein